MVTLHPQGKIVCIQVDGVLKGDLMDKAINYLDHFWIEIFNYRPDGRYNINIIIGLRCLSS